MKRRLRTIWVSVLAATALVGGCDRASQSLRPAEREIRPTSASAEVPATRSPQQFIAQTLQYNLDHRLLSVERNAAWQVLHGVIAYGRDLPLGVGERRVGAVEYLLGGGELQGWDLFGGSDLGDGRRGIRAGLEVGGYISQGHADQWLAILAQVGVELDEKVIVQGREHTIADWIDQAQLDTPRNPNNEYSWTLISTLKYRPERQQWKGIDGSDVFLEQIVDFEAKQNIVTSACGGTHRLMSLAMARDYAEAHNLTNEPSYITAAETLQRSLDTMRRFQNGDGSFSANYFDRPGTSSDLSLMISATGHQLELAAYALSDEEVKADWIRRAAIRLCEYLDAARDQPLECGGLYHGLNGLRIYHDRCFGKWTPNPGSIEVAVDDR